MLSAQFCMDPTVEHCDLSWGIMGLLGLWMVFKEVRWDEIPAKGEF